MIKNLVDRSVPVWVFLLCLLLGLLTSVMFGWAIKSTLAGSDRSGFIGEAAVEIASFPKLVREIYLEFVTEKDSWIRVPGISIDLSEFSDIKQKPGIGVTGLVIRADEAALARAPGWRVLVGVFVIDGEPSNAALALSPELEITQVWLLAENGVDDIVPQSPLRKFIHGFDIMSDGSVIFSFDGGVSLQRIDYCGSRVWATGGLFHHAVSLDEREESIWTLVEDEVARVSTGTGEIMQRFSMGDIIKANPTLDILEIYSVDQMAPNTNSRNAPGRWLDDPFHLNDVDPLPKKLANRYDGFEEDDLLLSSRTLNLIFVMDPDTLEIKWWRTGAVRRQHDPDWSMSGEITVYDNRMSRDYSRIVSIAPRSYRTKVLFDGRTNDFYSRIRGKHQFTEAGNLIVTSPQQGRIFEVDASGKTILEILNRKPEDGRFNYVISQALWLPADAFEIAEKMSCAN